ncbi:MAG: aminopeptidase [Betaproteobacteria bacterium SG8_40]|nr:MAG: aminopeptidase [Betaproteobacteria bacterium SG8_40]
MLNPAPRTVFLRNYAPPPYLVSHTDLDIQIYPGHTLVGASLTVTRNPQLPAEAVPLVLNGEDLHLEYVSIDGRELSDQEYSLSANQLTVHEPPATFALHTRVRIDPESNTRLMGLYASANGYFTQCEAEGFRRITFFPDRPDVMARYTTTIHADKTRFPVLLSNGNLVDQGDEAKGRHWAKWEDPFPKPSYLFAMVAGTLERRDDTFTTCSGRQVSLSIFVEPGKLDQSGFAMEALKRSMTWDEQRFGLEVDLDQYMIVAVSDFNMGAMENKGLNIFNTKYVLARPDISTDRDFMFLDRVVAHEYFHNWTGNRVTCRDWFQLSLKEGLTVFRDQEYGADTYSRAVQRIQEVRALRAAQFPEDAGPMAHPVRPQSYMEISNFYTATVYEKGAEVVRMIHSLLGESRFRAGMDLYFERHDGCAVTTDDFVQAMEDASGVNLAQFRRWYDEAGTPVLEITDSYSEEEQRYALRIRQSFAPASGQTDRPALHIPFAVGLVDTDGRDLALQLDGEREPGATTRLLSITQAEQEFVFVGVKDRPTPSLLRDFTAPVIAKFDYSEDDLIHLMGHDSDPFNRWEAGQRLASGIILRATKDVGANRQPVFPQGFFGAFSRVLSDAASDPAFAAEALALPSETYLAEQLDEVDPDALHAARNLLRRKVAETLKGDLLLAYQAFATSGEYKPDAASAGQRALRNLCLSYLMELDDDASVGLCMTQFEQADNMTDTMAALTALANRDFDQRQSILDHFYQKWSTEPLVVDKWLAVQAASSLPGTVDRVKALTGHAAFDLRNPNKVFSLIRTFGTNQVRFHAADGSGYAFLADQIIRLDPVNPQIAARVARCFDRWKKFDAQRQTYALEALKRIRTSPELSTDTTEVIARALA